MIDSSINSKMISEKILVFTFIAKNNMSGLSCIASSGLVDSHTTKFVHCTYSTCRYPSCTIVFDGYSDGPSTKDCTHLRRGHTGPAVLFESDMINTLKKEDFLSHPENKKFKSVGYCWLLCSSGSQ